MLDADVTQRLARPAQPVMRVAQVHTAVKHQRGMTTKDGDAAHAVGQHFFRGAIQQHHLRRHGEDIFETRRHLFEHHSAEAEPDRLNRRFVAVEKFAEPGWRLDHQRLLSHRHTFPSSGSITWPIQWKCDLVSTRADACSAESVWAITVRTCGSRNAKATMA